MKKTVWNRAALPAALTALLVLSACGDRPGLGSGSGSQPPVPTAPTGRSAPEPQKPAPSRPAIADQFVERASYDAVSARRQDSKTA